MALRNVGPLCFFRHQPTRPTIITFDAFFLVPQQKAAERLADALSTAGLEIQVSSSKSGLRRQVSWSVQASRGGMGADLDRLDVLVTELETTAEKHDSEFDGWGTELPPESS